MQWTGLNELREKYLSFFESKGHLRLDSFPLVPKNDPSLLLINSGMAPMKKWFLAQEEPPRHRGQLLLPGLLQGRGHSLGMGVPDQR